MVVSENREDGRDNTRSYVPITKGTMISHYKIIEKIGAGGMGSRINDTSTTSGISVVFSDAFWCRKVILGFSTSPYGPV